jgi:hypothetical protein
MTEQILLRGNLFTSFPIVSDNNRSTYTRMKQGVRSQIWRSLQQRPQARLIPFLHLDNYKSLDWISGFSSFCVVLPNYRSVPGNHRGFIFFSFVHFRSVTGNSLLGKKKQAKIDPLQGSKCKTPNNNNKTTTHKLHVPTIPDIFIFVQNSIR